MTAKIRTPLYEALNVEEAEALLVLTYEFQAEALARLFGALKSLPAGNILNKIRPIVVFDGLVTRENQPLQNFISLHSMSIRGGIHHSKAWCKLSPRGIDLTLGSFNLTENGVYRNREVFRTFTWRKKDSEGASIIKDFLTLLERSIGDDTAKNDILNFIGRCNSLTKDWTIRDSDVHLITNGYSSESGFQQLLREWNTKNGDPAALNLIVVSPFFDSSPDDNLLNIFKKNGIIDFQTKTSLISALNRKGIMPMLRLYAEKWQEYSGSEVIVAESKLNADKSEWSEVEKQTREISNESLRKENVLLRDLHAKILILCSKKESLIYIGSANFTQNAWTGKNRELGFTEWIKGNADEIVQKLTEGLSANKLKKWNSVAWAASPEDLVNEEDFAEKSGYPYCLLSALLRKIDDDIVQFLFSVNDNDAASLVDYQISWGKIAVTLTKSGDDSSIIFSQRFPLKSSLSLLLQNNLRLVPRSDVSIEHYFPITFDESLRSERAQAAFSGSDDWLIKFLMPDDGAADPGPGGDFDDAALEEDGNDETESLRKIDREENRTIAMQRFMTFYLQLEKNFKDQVEQFDSLISREPQLKTPFFKAGDPYSFTNYLRLLETELFNETNGFAESVFKLGEAKILLTKTASSVKNIDLKKELLKQVDLISESLERFAKTKPELSKKSVFSAYIELTKNIGKGVQQ